jgi:hypothetical protein
MVAVAVTCKCEKKKTNIHNIMKMNGATGNRAT